MSLEESTGSFFGFTNVHRDFLSGGWAFPHHTIRFRGESETLTVGKWPFFLPPFLPFARKGLQPCEKNSKQDGLDKEMSNHIGGGNLSRHNASFQWMKLLCIDRTLAAIAVPGSGEGHHLRLDPSSVLEPPRIRFIC